MSNLKFVIVIALLLLGCKKEEDSSENTIGEPQVNLMIKEVYENDTLVNSYTYDSENRVVSRTSYTEFGIGVLLTNYQYSGDTIIQESYNSNGDLSSIYKYYPYENNTIRRDHERLIGNIEFTYNLYYFTGNSCGYTFREGYNSDDILTNTSTAEYSGVNCNVIFTELDDNGQLYSTWEYLKNNRRSAYNSIRNRLFFPTSINNVTSSMRTDEFGEISSFATYDMTYTYNSDLYPESSIRSYYNGEVVNIEYVYF